VELTEVVNLLGKHLDPISLLFVSITFALWTWWYQHNKRIFVPDGGELTGEAEKRRLKDLAARKQWVENRHFEIVYLNLLGHMLDWLAIRFTRDRDRLEKNRKQKGWTVSLFGVQPFTEGSYQLCLNLAVIYPWIAFFLVWLLGGSGEISNLRLFQGEDFALVRFGTLFSSVLFVWAWWKAHHHERNNFWWNILFWLVFLFSIAIFPIVTIFSAAIALPIFALLQESYKKN